MTNSTENMIGKARPVGQGLRWPATPTTPSLPMVIIGVAGLARAGKDTLSDMLAPILGFARYSFAAPIKDMLGAGFFLNDKDEEGAQEICGCSYRKLVQTLGTEWGRNAICSDLWVRVAASRLEGTRTIISDVRFEDEAEFVRKHGVLIHIKREPEHGLKAQEGLSKEEKEHSSEDGVQIKHNDYVVLNNWDLHFLEHNVVPAVIEDLNFMLVDKEAWDLDCLHKPLGEVP